MRTPISSILIFVQFAVACARPPGPLATPRVSAAPSPSGKGPMTPTREAATNADVPSEEDESRIIAASAPPACTPFDWATQTLAPLLKRGKSPSSSWPDREGSAELVFDSECSDSPGGPVRRSPNPVVVDGVEIRLVDAVPAGSSRRGWTGNQCAFELRLADGSGRPVRLGRAEVPRFTALNAVVRAGSAAWISVSFNGYTSEFPDGGNRVIALDLCEGRVVWKSKDSTSNGGLLLLDDYLVSPYGFTTERRYVFVLDARSGAVIQKLPVIENICPSKRWAPNWHPGERCDAPGQTVGAATAPRIEGGVFLVDTNTGSTSFELAVPPRSEVR